MSRFPQTGLAAIMDLTGWSGNVRKYLADMARMEKAEAASVKSSRKAAKAMDGQVQAVKQALQPMQRLTEHVTKLLSGVGGMPATLSNAANGLFDLGTSATGAVESLGTLGISLSSTTLLLGAAVVATTAAVAAFVKLGMRGAAMPGVIRAFDYASARAGVLSATLLGDLRRASAGTVADMQLMRTANVALAGASKEVAQALGQGGLAGLMKIARAQAKATGQSVEYLFDSLVSGIKRSSPMLIDNTGLVLKVSEANAAYAKQLGKSVDQLTAQEKQIALLNATLEAGKEAVAAYGGGALTAAERMARMSATVTNTLDKAALATQPLFNLVLAIGQTLLDVIVWPLDKVLLPLIYEVSNAVFGPLTQAWEAVTGAVGDVLSPVLHTLHRWLTLIVAGLRLVGRGFHWLLEQAGKAFSPIANVVKRYIVEPIAKWLDPAEFAKRGGYVFGAFASGILWAANTLIFPAVIDIAEFIRDFLMGFSPPKRGPLRHIDKGGANVMAAWLEGFAGVPLTPVQQMAAQVDAELGSIGKMSHGQVVARLAQLDAALQPFIDHLEIVKAKFEALTEPLKRVQEGIKKRLTATVKDFLAGKVGLEAVQTLDRQSETIARQLRMYEGMTEQAELQLALMKARQARERALLMIQKRRTEQAAKQSKTAQKATTAAGRGGATGDLAAAVGGGAGGFADLLQEDPLGAFLGVTDEDIAQLWGDMKGGFAEGLATAPGFADNLAAFEENRQRLSEVFGEIGQTPAFQGLRDTFNNIFGDGEDSIRTKVSRFVDDVKRWFTEDLPGVFDGFSLSGLKSVFQGAFGLRMPGSISELVGGARDMISVIFGKDGTLASLLDNFSLDTLKETWNGIFGENGRIPELLGEFGEQISGVFKWEEGGMLHDLIQGVADSFETTLLTPIRAAFNTLISVVWGAIGAILDQWNALLDTVIGANSGWLGDTLIPDDAVNMLEGLKLSLGEPPQFRRGGFVHDGGLARVHRGEVLVSSPTPYTVFPARWVAAMERIAERVGAYAMPLSPRVQPVVVEQRTGTTVTQHFHGNADAASLRRTMYELSALGVVG